VFVTEATTAAALLGLVWGPSALVLGLALVFGFGLNGTSSVLYAAVAALVPEGNRGRGYGIYYTGVELASFAPLGYGLVADRVGLDPTFALMAALTLTILPLAVPLRRRLHG
jgi:MFS family permease